MACSDCGARKGHLKGCPQESGGKRGGRPAKQDKARGRSARVPGCHYGWGGYKIAKHPDVNHVCIEPKGHSGSHVCGVCGETK
jgi:hypothetical protein